MREFLLSCNNCKSQVQTRVWCSVWFAYLSYLFQHREYKFYTPNKWPRLKVYYSTVLGTAACAFLLFNSVKSALRRLFWEHSTLLFSFLNFFKLYFQSISFLNVSKVPNFFYCRNKFVPVIFWAFFLSLKTCSLKVGIVFPLFEQCLIWGDDK